VAVSCLAWARWGCGQIVLGFLSNTRIVFIKAKAKRIEETNANVKKNVPFRLAWVILC
jgi:hypothetical protein